MKKNNDEWLEDFKEFPIEPYVKETSKRRPNLERSEFDALLEKWLAHFKVLIDKRWESKKANQGKVINPVLSVETRWLFAARKGLEPMIVIRLEEKVARANGPDTTSYTWAMVAMNGDIYAPGSYGKPARWIRCNLQDENAYLNCTHSGPKPIGNSRHGYGDDTLSRKEIARINGVEPQRMK